RPRTALAAVQHVEADVGRDAVEPRPQRSTALESIEPTPGTDQGLMDGVLRLEGGPEHPVAVARQLRPMLLEPLLKRLPCRFDAHPDRHLRDLAAGGNLLHGPPVPVWIAEEDERAPVEMLDLAHVHPACGELFPRGADVLDDELQTLDGARLHGSETGAEGDRARRFGRRELDEADFVA